MASLDIRDNVLPFISGEEEKIESETKKILGRFSVDHIEEAPVAISAQCHRVNVMDGPMAAVRVELRRKASIGEVRAAFGTFRSVAHELQFQSAPKSVITMLDQLDRPQPGLDRDAGTAWL